MNAQFLERADQLLPTALKVAARATRCLPDRPSPALASVLQFAQQVAHFGLASDLSLFDVRALRLDLCHTTCSASSLEQRIGQLLLNIVEQDLKMCAMASISANDQTSARLVREANRAMDQLEDLVRQAEQSALGSQGAIVDGG